MTEGKNVSVPLPGDAVEALVDLAVREWRNPRDQAAMFVIEGLRRAGALPEQNNQKQPVAAGA